MSVEIDQHIEAVEECYEPLIVGKGARLVHGDQLWSQFQSAVAVYRKNGIASFRPVMERTNELAVARITLFDPIFARSEIQYEPAIIPDGRRIDFVVVSLTGDYLYREVKTVHPKTEDSKENWDKYERRRELHTPNTEFIVGRDWLGAQIYGNSFSARASFLKYALEFESRLAAANERHAGSGELIFCCPGFHWNKSELEDFADFYRTVKHRPDDPFAKMEAVGMATNGTTLARTISAFGYMERPDDFVTHQEWVPNVRGPAIP